MLGKQDKPRKSQSEKQTFDVVYFTPETKEGHATNACNDTGTKEERSTLNIASCFFLFFYGCQK